MLVVQERRRFYRESITAFLRRQLATTEVGEGVVDAARLMAVAEAGRLDHAVIEADGVPWDVGALAASLRDRHRDIHLIGLTTSSRPARYEGIALVPRNAPPDQVAKLLEPDALRLSPPLSSASRPATAMALSPTNSYVSSPCSAWALPSWVWRLGWACQRGGSLSRRWPYLQSSAPRARLRP